MSTPPVIRLRPGHDKRLRAGHPWIYANEVVMDDAALAVPPGTAARFKDPAGQTLALGHFNPHSLIVGRVLSRDRRAEPDAAFVERRLARALRVRERLFDAPYYRLVHAEADQLPGLVVDRMGDTVVLQLNTAGMVAAEAAVLAAVERVLTPEVVILRNDSPGRALEGLEPEVRVVKGTPGDPVWVRENGLAFAADVTAGQKTGWYFDQRANRAFAAHLCRGERVLDLYSYSGGFGLPAAAGDASEVLLIDRSEPALALARRSAEAAGLTNLRFERADAFAAIEALASAKERFGVVLADPPAFAKSRKEASAALQGYRKLVRGLAPLIAEGGFLAVSSCAHAIEADAFAEAVRRGLREAGRPARLLRRSGADADHPLHPALPESAYLTFLVYALD